MDQIIELTVQEHYKSLVCWAIVKKSFEIIFFLIYENSYLVRYVTWRLRKQHAKCILCLFQSGKCLPFIWCLTAKGGAEQSAVLRWGGSPVCTDCECECGQPAWAKAQRLLQLLKCKRYDVYDWVKKWYYIPWWVRVFELFLTLLFCVTTCIPDMSPGVLKHLVPVKENHWAIADGLAW